MGDGSHLFQRRTASQIFRDVLDDCVELPAPGQPAGAPLEVTDQANG